MTATITPQSANLTGIRQGLKIAHRKDKQGLYRSYSVLDLTKRYRNEANKAVEVRVYWPSSACYACVWINHGTIYGNGSGRATGGGYCLESAAISAAFDSCGIKFAKNFDAAGMEAVREALSALAVDMGLTDFVIVESHG